MEEKKVTKISLSTFFLILAIIAIIVMGIFMYKLYNEKTEPGNAGPAQAFISRFCILGFYLDVVNVITIIFSDLPQPS